MSPGKLNFTMFRLNLMAKLFCIKIPFYLKEDCICTDVALNSASFHYVNELVLLEEGTPCMAGR